MGIKERKVREKEQRRERIIDAGEKLFLKKGLHGATMDEIAGICELSKGTLYLYFESKEQLYLAIILRAMTIMYDMMYRYQDAIEDPILRLRKIGEAYLDFYRQYPEHFVLQSSMPDPEVYKMEELREIGMQIQEQGKNVWLLMSRIINDGIEKGIFKDNIDPYEVSMSLWGIMTFIINIMDHSGKIPSPAPDKGSNLIGRVDYMQSLDLNAKRIVFSILKNPPDDFDFYSKDTTVFGKQQ